jgi:hypothetical protein
MLRSPEAPKEKGQPKEADNQFYVQTIPRMLNYDPTIPPVGSRSTYFTTLSTRSFDSIKSMSRRKLLNEFMAVRINPSELIFENYELGRLYEKPLTIHNHTKRIQYISISNTTTNEFELSHGAPLEEVAIAPGLEKKITIRFRATEKEGCDSFLVYKDVLDVLIRNGSPVKIKMSAFPPACCLSFETVINFGTVMLNRELKAIYDDIIRQEPHLDVGDELETWRARKEKIREGWISRNVKIWNEGNRVAEITFEFDESLPIKLSHSRVLLQPLETLDLQVHMLPINCGGIASSVKIIVLNDYLNTDAARHSTNYTLQMSGMVVPGAFTLRSMKKDQDILQNESIEFGNVFFGQTCHISVQMTNVNDSPHRWSINNDRTNNLLSAISKTQLTGTFRVEPCEGYLQPGECTIVKFYFNPKPDSIKVGFSSLLSPSRPRECLLNYILRVSDLNSDETLEEKKLTIRGRGIPIDLKWSKKRIQFTKEVSNEHFTITNLADEPLDFSLEKVAHFSIRPRTGKLSPNETISISVAFRPNQFGLFQIQSQCSFKMISNLEEFVDERFFENVTVLNTSIELIGTHLPSPNGIKENEIKPGLEWLSTKTHKQKYIDYIRTLQTGSTRRKLKIKSLDQEVDIDSQLDSELRRKTTPDDSNGLLPPEPLHQLSDSDIMKDDNNKVHEKTKIQPYIDKMKDGTLHAPIPIDPVLLPQDWQHIQLTKDELSQLHSSTNVIDFGEVTVNSENKYPLNFLNAIVTRLPVNITLSVTTQSNDHMKLSLSHSSLNLLYLGIAGTEVKLNADIVGGFTGTLHYTLNRKYNYHIPIKASVKPLCLKASSTALDVPITQTDSGTNIRDFPSLRSFCNIEMDNEKNAHLQIQKDSKTVSTSFGVQRFQLTNPGNTEAFFKILEDSPNLLHDDLMRISSGVIEGTFHFSTVEGVVQPKSQIEISTIYIPGTKPITELTVSIEVYDQISKVNSIHRIDLNLRGIGAIAECTFSPALKQGPLDFGSLPIHYPSLGELYDSNLTAFSKSYSGRFSIQGAKVVKIKNTGIVPFTFVAFVSSRPQDFELAIASGIVKESQICELTIKVNPLLGGSFEDTLVVNIMGSGKSFKIPMKYEGRKPHVELSRLSTSFQKEVFVGSISNESFILHNRGSVYGRLVLDLSEYPEFWIQTREDRRGLSGRAKSSNATTARTTISSATSMRTTEKTIQHMSYFRSNNRRYGIVDCPPGEKVYFDVFMKPEIEKKINSSILGFLLGQTNPDDDSTSMDIPIAVQCLPCPLQFSALEFVFPNRILRPELSKRNDYFHTMLVSFCNISVETIKWNAHFVTVDSEPDVFRLENCKGTIDPKGRCELKLSFQPFRAGEFQSTLNVDIQQNGSRSSIPLSVIGTAINPSLTFYPPEIFLPVIPLEETCTATVMIKNVGCEVGELKAFVPDEVRMLGGSLDFSYPDGCCIRNDGDEIPCVITYSAGTKPAAFVVKVPFEDSEKNLFFLTIRGCTEVSLFSLQPFYLNEQLNANRVQEQFISEEGFSQFKTPAGVVVKNSDEQKLVELFYCSTGTMISRWFYEQMGLKSPELLYPLTIASTNGTALINLISALSGKKLNLTRVVNSSMHHDESSSLSVLAKYRDILTFLISHGGTLSCVKPEYLLGEEHFPIEPLTSGGKHAYSIFSKVTWLESWTITLLQTIKVFLFQTRPPFKKGLKAQSDSLTTSPNHKGVGYTENTLLEWCASQIAKYRGKQMNLIRFGDDFRDCVVFRDIILSCVPQYEAKLKGLTNSKTIEGDRQNAKCLIAVLKSLLGSSIFEIVDGAQSFLTSPVEQAMLTLLLSQTLPQLIPKTIIDYHGSLHEKIVRNVEISNISSEPIGYTVELFGDSEFSVKENSFMVPSKSSYTLAVEFQSRFIRASNATMIVRSKKVLLNSHSILTFKLQATVEPATPLSIIRMEAPMYSQANFKASIRSPFPIEGNFEVVVKNQRIVIVLNLEIKS